MTRTARPKDGKAKTRKATVTFPENDNIEWSMDRGARQVMHHWWQNPYKSCNLVSHTATHDILWMILCTVHYRISISWLHDPRIVDDAIRTITSWLHHKQYNIDDDAMCHGWITAIVWVMVSSYHERNPSSTIARSMYHGRNSVSNTIVASLNHIRFIWYPSMWMLQLAQDDCEWSWSSWWCYNHVIHGQCNLRDHMNDGIDASWSHVWRCHGYCDAVHNIHKWPDTIHVPCDHIMLSAPRMCHLCTMMDCTMIMGHCFFIDRTIDMRNHTSHHGSWDDEIGDGSCDRCSSIHGAISDDINVSSWSHKLFIFTKDTPPIVCSDHILKWHKVQSICAWIMNETILHTAWLMGMMYLFTTDNSAHFNIIR